MDFFNDRDYVITTVGGDVLGPQWQYVKKKMDRFMIPKERTDLYNATDPYSDLFQET
jgi:hypothetical protein